jgi:hypothetical protein
MTKYFGWMPSEFETPFVGEVNVNALSFPQRNRLSVDVF